MNWYKHEFGKEIYWTDPMGKRKITFYKNKDKNGKYIIILERKIRHKNNTVSWKFIKEFKGKTKTDAMKHIRNVKKNLSYWR